MRRIGIPLTCLTICLTLAGSTLSGQTKTDAQRESQEVTQFFNNFLHTWLVEQNVDKASKYFDKKKLESNTRQMFFVYPPSFNSNIWIRKVLTMWLASDYGGATEFDLGEPNKSGYSSLPLSPSGLKTRVHWQNVTEAKTSLSLTKKTDRQNAYLAMLTLKNAPGNDLLFFIEKINNKWRITLYTWLVA